jgi:cell division protein FtsB
VIQAKYAPIVLFLLALLVLGSSLLSEQGVREIRTLERALAIQREENSRLSDRVSKLKEELKSVMSSDRGLERAAREDLGLVRPNEKIFVFE